MKDHVLDYDNKPKHHKTKVWSPVIILPIFYSNTALCSLQPGSEMSDRDQGSVRRDQSNTVASGPVRNTPLHKHAPGVSGVKENTTGWKTSEQSLPSCWNVWETLQSFPSQEKFKSAKKVPRLLCFLIVQSQHVRAHVCMCAIMCFQTCIRIGGKHKGREGSWGHFCLRLSREKVHRKSGRGGWGKRWRQGGTWKLGCWAVQGRECRDNGGNMQIKKKIKVVSEQHQGRRSMHVINARCKSQY